MKLRHLLLVATLLILSLAATARAPRIEPSYAWRVLPPMGLREITGIDTLMLNYHRSVIPSLASDAWVTTGNYGAEGINMIFAERQPRSNFFLMDALSQWIPSLATQRFYNTRIPMTLVTYNTGGGPDHTQDRLKADFSGNINARAQVGARVDYLYSKGSYANQADKHLSWGFNGSYIGPRYEFQGFYNHWNLVNKENGGITDLRYILDPEEVQGGLSSVDPATIPTRLTSAHTRVKGEQLFLNNRYKLGYWREEYPDEDNDTLVVRTFVPVTSFVWTLDYQKGTHEFDDPYPAEIRKFLSNTYINPSKTHDETGYSTLTNTVGVALLEGFNRYAKFGLSAYATYELRRYKQTPDTLDRNELNLDPLPGVFEPRKTQSAAYVGAQLTKQNGSLITYKADGRLGILGPAAGDVYLNGDVLVRIPLPADSLRIQAFGRFENREAPYLMQNFISNHIAWQRDFGKERTLTVGGRLAWPYSGTFAEVSATNIQNYIYFGPDYTPQQHSGSLQVLSARVDQRLALGIFHWDNSVTYQKSTNETVLSLPQLAVYSNMYLLFRIATLHVQLGIDCNWYTKYYAPKYQPTTASFAVQHETKLGNYPWTDIYLDMKLSKVRFYLQMSHFNQGLFGGRNYFSTPNYPLNPRRFLLGLSVDFAN